MSTPAISKLRGTGYNQISLPTKNSDQMEIFRRLMGGSSEGVDSSLSQISKLAGGGSPELWQQLEAPAMRQFGELQGNIASRFSGMGTGARRSSGFQNATTSAASELAERLQGQRLGLQQNAQSQLLDLYQNLLGHNMQENMLIPKKKSGWQTFFEGLGQIGGNAAGTFGGMGLGKLFF